MPSFLVLCARFVLGLLLTTLESFLGLFMLHELGYPATMSGLVLTLFATLFSLTQAPTLLLKMARTFTEKQVIIGGFIALSVSMFMWSQCRSLRSLLIAVSIFSLGAGFLNPLVSSLVSRLAGPTDKGGFLGLSASLGSVTRIVAPLLGGYMVEGDAMGQGWGPGYRGPPLAAAALAMVMGAAFCLVSDSTLVPRSAKNGGNKSQGSRE